MMLFKQSFFNFIKALLIMCTFIAQTYQQKIIKTKTLNKDLTFCIQNHTMSNTLQTFWHDANDGCELESKHLIELYTQLLQTPFAKKDKCSNLIKHQIRKKLIQVMSKQLEEAFAVECIEANKELKQDLKDLQEIDKQVSQIVWQRALNEVYLLIKPEDLFNTIGQLKEEQEIQIVALQSLFNKYLQVNDLHSETLIPLLTFHLNSLFKSKNSSALFLKNLQRLYRRLPKILRLLYESSQQNKIGLLSYHHFEYLYAPRDNGPDGERRLPLTWIETKNSTDSDGHLVATFNDKSLVALGSHFGTSLKYLYADSEEKAAYFWIGSGQKSSQWWQVIWPHDLYLADDPGYLMFRNAVTKELLCATIEYDENRRYVTLLNANENFENPACFWLVTRF